MAEYFSNSDAIFFTIIISITTIFFFFFFFFLTSIKKSKSLTPPLPPGPNPWPIISTITHLKNPKPLHTILTSLSQIHGPLMHLRFGSRRLVVASSPAAAAAVLKSNDRLLSGRSVPAVVPKSAAEIHRLSFWADSTSRHWRSLRALCRAELFSAAALDRAAAIRAAKSAELVAALRRNAANLGNVQLDRMVLAAVVNISSNVYFSENVAIGFGDDDDENPMAGILRGIGEAFGAKNLSDLYPILRGLDLQGLRRKYMDCSVKMWRIWEQIVKERRLQSELKRHDFMETLILRGFGDDQINHLLEDLFTGGIHTTSSTIMKTMMELLKSPESLTKLRDELDTAFDGGRDPLMTSSNVDDQPYLQACIKETLRLHPPAPLMLTHRAYETCQLMNYTVPENTGVIVNVSAIGRNPAVWADPLQYQPERFLGSSIDFKGNNFEFLPFGAGRRICPGMGMATKIMALIVASLVYYFDWSPTTPEREGPLLLAPRARR